MFNTFRFLQFCFQKRLLSAVMMLLVIGATGAVEITDTFIIKQSHECRCKMRYPRLCAKYGLCAMDGAGCQESKPVSGKGVVLSGSCNCNPDNNAVSPLAFNHYRFLNEDADIETFRDPDLVEIKSFITACFIKNPVNTPESPPPESYLS